MEGGREKGMAAGGRRVDALGLSRVILPFMPLFVARRPASILFSIAPSKEGYCLWMPPLPFHLSLCLITASNHLHHATNRKEKLA